MSNLGLYRALDKAGIKYEQTTVGDRYVYENMRANGHTIGGEQSGHTILSKYATTGDGILTAIMVMEAMIEAKAPLSKLKSPVIMYPQITVNVRVKDKSVIKDKRVTDKADEVKAILGDKGRILLRESGTEPVVRVMVEAEDDALCRLANDVADVIREISFN